MNKPHPQIRIVPQNPPVTGERLDSWKEIARYLKRDVRTVQRWEKTDGLPVYRKTAGQKSGPVYAFASEIDTWLHRNPPSLAEKEDEPEPAVQAGPRTKGIVWAVASLLILSAGGWVTWHLLNRGAPLPPPRVVSLTSYSGMEMFPAFSPDGKLVAFSWNGRDQDNFDIYVKYVDSEEPPRRLTTDPAMDGWPTFSPNGQYIAFARRAFWGAPDAELMIVSVLGGAERPIRRFRFPLQHSRYWPGGCWTPDGNWGVVPLEPEALGLISMETHEVKRLTEPPSDSSGDCCPAISPDGRTLAFLRASPGRIWNLQVLSLGPDYLPLDSPKQMTSELAGVENPMWTGDGREVLYITNREGERTLWRMPIDGSRSASPIESLGLIGENWAISPLGDRLAFQESGGGGADIWRMDLAGEQGIRSLLASSKGDLYPAISPDGKKIAFVSNREKGWRLWVSNFDGTNPIDLAPIIGWRPGAVRWSPDGKEIVFECKGANDDVCAVPSGGGAIRRVTSSPARDLFPSWSHDPKWIYVTSNRSGTFEIWKVPSDGTEAGAVQLTHGGGYGALEAEDGVVYFSREHMNSTIWRIPAQGGEEIQFGNFRNMGQASCFGIGRKGIYYTSSKNPESAFGVWLCRFSDGQSERISPPIQKTLANGLSVSPDDRYILFSAGAAGQTDLRLVKDFR